MAKVAIVGAGAMGSVYAGLMASAGHEVHLVSQWQDHVDAIADEGLRVEGVSGDRTVRVHAATSTDGIGACDLVIIATKAMDVADAARSATSLVSSDTVVQTSQNGLGSGDAAVSVLGPEHVVIGVVGGFGASIRAPGHVHHNGMEMVRLGSVPQGPGLDMVERAARVWRSADFEVSVFDDIERMVWEKLIMNVTFSATCCLTGLTIGEVLNDTRAWSLAAGCLDEAVAVASALQVDVQVGDPITHVRTLAGKIPEARPSMLLDHLAGRRSEIDWINGSVVHEGEKVGVSTPVNWTMVELVKLRERDFSDHTPLSAR